MTPEEYKKLSVKEFTQAAKIYDSGHAGIYEMCKKIILRSCPNWKKSLSAMSWTVAVEPAR